MGSLSPWHWAIIVIVAFALFGYKKLPDATRSVGRSLRIFKSEMQDLVHNDDDGEDKKPAAIEGSAKQPTASPQPVAQTVQPPLAQPGARPAPQRPAAQQPTVDQPAAPVQPSVDANPADGNPADDTPVPAGRANASERT